MQRLTQKLMNSTPDQQKDLMRDRFTLTAEVFRRLCRGGAGARGGIAREVARFARRRERLSISRAARGLWRCDSRGIVRWICGLDLTPAILKRARASAAAERLRNIRFRDRRRAGAAVRGRFARRGDHELQPASHVRRGARDRRNGASREARRARGRD